MHVFKLSTHKCGIALQPTDLLAFLMLVTTYITRLREIQFNMKKAILDLFLRSAPHSRTFAQMCTTVTFLDELELKKHLNVCLRKVAPRTLERFLNLRCPAVSDFFRFRIFIQLRSQSDASVM